MVQVIALWLHLSQSCRLRYTRKTLERKVTRGSRRASRSNNLDNPGILETSFSCDGRVEGGYYGDPEAGCQVFHVCTNDGNNGLTKQSFSCPEGTLFQQKYFVCDWSSNVDCSKAQDFYDLNNRARESRKATFEEMKSQEAGERACFRFTAKKYLSYKLITGFQLFRRHRHRGAIHITTY